MGYGREGVEEGRARQDGKLRQFKFTSMKNELLAYNYGNRLECD